MLQEGVAIGVFIAVACERITEWLLALVFAAIAELKVAWYEKIGTGIKALIAAAINAGWYWLLFRFDFVSPLLKELGVTIAPWQGLVFCTLLVAGGSNLVHEFFSFFKNGRNG